MAIACLLPLLSGIACKRGASSSSENYGKGDAHDRESAGDEALGTTEGGDPIGNAVVGPNTVIGPETLQGKPDKMSEESSGLPGYPLVSRWQKPPTLDNPAANITFFLADAKGALAPDIKDSTWTVGNNNNEVMIVEQASTTGQISLILTGPTRDIVLRALIDLNLSVRFGSNREQKTTGRELIKAGSNEQRVASDCGSLFSMMLADDRAMLTFSQVNPFEGCEKLANALQNRTFPDPSVRGLPSKAKTVSASCNNTDFTLTIKQPLFTGNVTQGTLNTDICKDLASFVNAQGL